MKKAKILTKEIIKEECILKGLTVSGLEQKLGYANGSLKKDGALRSDRLLEVARELNVSMEFLMGVDEFYLNPLGKRDAKLAAGIFELIETDGGFDELIEKYFNLSDTDRYEVLNFVDKLYLQKDIPAYTPDIKKELLKLSKDELNSIIVYAQAIIDTRDNVNN